MRTAPHSLLFAALLTLPGLPALSHSGGLDRNGCHAGSRPYHCHNGGSSRSTARIAPQRVVPQANPDLRRLQAVLNRMGYDCGPEDGFVGPRTRACIAAFHRDEGTGPDTDYVVTTRRANARQAARAAVPVAPIPMPAPVPPPSRKPEPELPAPVPPTRAEITRVQAFLAEQNLYAGRFDGVLDFATRFAITTYETQRRRPRTGQITPWILGASRGSTVPVAQAPKPVPAPPTARTRSSVPKPTPAEIRAVQTFLAEQGFMVGHPDGTVNWRTQSAIYGHEAQSGRDRTGRITPWLLEQALRAGTAAEPPALTGRGEFVAVAILVGGPHGVGGDGLMFGDVEVRLQGIAAPEDSNLSRQPGGPEATAELRRLAEGREVVCRLDGTTTGRDTGNRLVGRCVAGDADLGESLVRSGFARDCPTFSGGDYAEAEAAAQRAGLDLSRTYDLPGYCR